MSFRSVVATSMRLAIRLLFGIGVLLAWPCDASARISVEFSDEVRQKLKDQGRNPDEELRRLDREFNAGLEELGKTNADAKSLFESGQKIRIICHGSKEALDAGLKPAEVSTFGMSADTRGDFADDGRPKRNGTAIIAVDCGAFVSVALDQPVAEDPASAPFRVLIHELLHASNRSHVHDAEDLSVYEQFVRDFLAALQRARPALEEADRRERMEERRRRRAQTQQSTEAPVHSRGSSAAAPVTPGVGRVHSRALSGSVTTPQQSGVVAPAGSFYIPGTDTCIRLSGRVPVNGVQQPFGPNVCFDIGGGGEFYSLPTQKFLAREMGGLREFGLFRSDKAATGFNVNGGLTVNTTDFFNPFDRANWQTFVRTRISYSEVSQHQTAGTIDPGVNHLLLIPGPLGGATGFSLGFHPLNIVNDARYTFDYSQVRVKFDAGITVPIGRGTISPYAGFSYGRSWQNQTFWAAIPGFNRDFWYVTRVNVDTWGFHLGAGGNVPIATIPGGLGGDFWDVALRYAGEFGAFHVSGTGTDRLDFTGFPTSTADLDKSKWKLGWKIEGGVELAARNGFGTIYLGGGFEERPGFAVVRRNGNDPSRLSLRDAEVWSATARWQRNFNPN